MNRLQIGEIVILILALIGGGWSWRGNPGGYVWTPNVVIAVIAFLMLVGVFFK